MSKEGATPLPQANPHDAAAEAITPVPPADAQQPAASEAAFRANMKKIETAVADAFGFSAPKREPGTIDTATQLASERTSLALERSAMATERTLQAWIRTALSMISFGFTIGKLGQAMKGIEIQGAFRHEWSIGGLAYMLVVLGTVSLFVACIQHFLEMRSLGARGLRGHLSIAFIVAVVLTVMGMFSFSALVLNL